jgi:hypothetical protein
MPNGVKVVIHLIFSILYTKQCIEMNSSLVFKMRTEPSHLMLSTIQMHPFSLSGADMATEAAKDIYFRETKMQGWSQGQGPGPLMLQEILIYHC